LSQFYEIRGEAVSYLLKWIFYFGWKWLLKWSFSPIILKILSPKNCRINWQVWLKTYDRIKRFVFKENAKFCRPILAKTAEKVILTFTIGR
jgi:hypothetical protein